MIKKVSVMNAMLEKLATTIGEGFQTDSDYYGKDHFNVFHRSVTVNKSGNLSFIAGLAISGLRGTAFVSQKNLELNLPEIATAARNHLPLVISVFRDRSDFHSTNFYQSWGRLVDTGCFQFHAADAQEHANLLLVAHRVAELALVPSIIIADYECDQDEQIALPAAEVILKYLGAPEDQIDVPTPAQKIVFGSRRRRIPNWFSYDNPVSSGLNKDGLGIAFEHAANQKYFLEHLPDLIQQAISEFSSLVEIDIMPVAIHNAGADYALLCHSVQVAGLFDQNKDDFKNFELILINQLNPLPDKLLQKRLSNKKAVTVLENISVSEASGTIIYKSIVSLMKEYRVPIYSCQMPKTFSVGLLHLVLANMTSKTPREKFILGIPFIKDHTNYPKHQVLLQEIEKYYPHLLEESMVASAENVELISPASEVSGMLRQYQNRGPVYTRQSRFYDDTGFFFHNDRPEELVADPFAAIPLSPAASAGFNDQTKYRKNVPVFKAENCTGCGECFLQCPHSALPPIAIGIEQLLRVGSGIVTAKNMTVTRITPLIRNMAKACAGIIGDRKVNSLKDFLPEAFDRVSQQMHLDGDKLEVATSEFNAIMEELGEFPLAITESFYIQPDTLSTGSGELFSVVVNPVACTGCGICVAACPEEALDLEDSVNINTADLINRFHLWEQFPDTPSDTIRRLQHDQSYSSLAAAMLSRNYYLTMMGGSQYDLPGSKQLLHLILSLSEASVQPRVLEQIKLLDKAIEQLSENVHKKLSEALPTENLEDFAETLNHAKRRKIHLQDLMNQASEELQGKFIDSEELRRKTDLIRDLKNLKWTLEEGPSGTGRARFGILAAGETLEWMAQYPFNFFTQPVVFHREGAIADKALGLFLGQLRYQIDHLKLLRRADLETRDKYDPPQHDLEIAELDWQSLTEAEKKSISPILVVIDRNYLDREGWAQIHKLLSRDFPIKVILLDGLAYAPGSGASESQLNAGILSAISLKNAYVFKGSLGDVNHLYDGLMNGLFGLFPSLFHLYCPDFSQHSDENRNQKTYGQFAVLTRAFPLISFNPLHKNDFLRGAINLEENPDYEQNWVSEKIDLTSGDTVKYPWSWADWAFTQKVWKDHFVPFEELGNWVFVPDYLKLNAADRINTNAVILRSNVSGLKYYKVSPAVIEMSEMILDQWRTWQELSGVLYEFPVKLQETIEKKLTSEFEVKIASLDKQYQMKLKEQENTQMARVKEQLKQRLITLSQMAKNKVEN